MNRRQFITGLPAAFLIAGQEAVAAPSAHPLSRLKDIATGENYKPDPKTFDLVLCMTAQKNKPRCGSAFLSAESVSEGRPIQPILVLPKISDQSSPEDISNLTRAMSSKAGFKILTGDISDIRAAARKIGGFFSPAQGKISDHSEEAFFLSPSGGLLFKTSYDDNITMMMVADQIIQKCETNPTHPACG
jgi:hypothetical protein